uniref:Putative secreted protein n=1 Tax=Ixodes ricinus TaxID=34613 RepID=A0A6B0UMT1_IXORI
MQLSVVSSTFNAAFCCQFHFQCSFLLSLAWPLCHRVSAHHFHSLTGRVTNYVRNMLAQHCTGIVIIITFPSTNDGDNLCASSHAHHFELLHRVNILLVFCFSIQRCATKFYIISFQGMQE